MKSSAQPANGREVPKCGERSEFQKPIGERPRPGLPGIPLQDAQPESDSTVAALDEWRARIAEAMSKYTRRDMNMKTVDTRQIKQAVAQYGYAAAKKHALETYGPEAVRFGEQCFTTRTRWSRRHEAVDEQ